MTHNGTANGALVVEGTVEATNDRGLRVKGEWLNRSQFRPVTLPDVGASVHVEVDAKGFIKSLEVVESQQPSAAAQDRDERISRLAVLKAAAAFGASRSECKSSDVLKIADVWLAWVEQSPQKGDDR